ncbi:MAG TPA: hypothetical protein VE463_01380 [Blastococcus sp.]|nr:hypothetical protein [Blastococcus sp.]
MSSAGRSRVRRSLLVVLAAVAVTAPVLTAPGRASADDEVAAGDTVVGEFVQVWQEFEDHDEAVEHADGALLSFVRAQTGETVRLDTDDVDDLTVGATVELTVGGTVADAASQEGLDRAHEVLATEVLEGAPDPTAPADVLLDHEVTVVMVTPAGGVQDGTTLDDVVEVVDGGVADFWWEQAHRRVGVVESHDWITTAADCSDPFELWDEVAAKVGFVRTHRAHLLLYVTSAPADLDCSYGLGTVGPTTVDGGYAYVREAATSVIAHELGHNFNLGHSSARQCDATLETGTCAVVPYADYYDVMGYSWDELGSLSMAQAARLGHVLPHEMREIHPESAAQTVTLAPVSQLSGLRGIQLWGGPGKVYWLEYRPALGRDAWIPGAGFEAGVQLRHIPGAGSDYSLLLDGSPSSRAGWARDVRTALPLSTPVRLADGRFTVTVTAVSATGATVKVDPLSAIGRAHADLGGDTGPLGPPTAAETCGNLGVIAYCRRPYANGEIHWRVDSPAAFAIHGGLHAAWVAAGGLATTGLPTSGTTCGLAAGGCSQTFASTGAMYWSAATGLRGTSGAIRSFWLANGGPAGLLGYPDGDLGCGAASCQQSFQGGTVVWSPSRGTIVVQGPIRAAWTAAGGAAGALGLPTTALGCGMVRNGCGQQFEKGSLYWSEATGAHAVTGPIWQLWTQHGWERGFLGYASGDMECGLAGGGCRQAFQGGVLTWSPATGARFTNGAIGAAWVAGGREAGALGYPSLPMGCGLPKDGCGQQFQGGSVYWTAATGAHAVTGPIWQLWTGNGWERGPLGYAAADMECGLAAGGCRQVFQGGTATWSAATGAQFTNGAIGAAWAAGGREAGALGYPLLPMGCGMVADGCGQQFQNGSVYWTPTAGAHAVTGQIWQYWMASRWERGPLGYARTDLDCTLTGGGCRQDFTGGSVLWSTATGAHATYGAIRTHWLAGGAEAGPLGYPDGEMTCGATSCSQSFQNGTAVWSSAAGVQVVQGAIRTAWAASGGDAGPLRVPLAPATCGLPDDGCRQEFQGGTIASSTTTGAWATYGVIRSRWDLEHWGYPTGEMSCDAVACTQQFQSGPVTWTQAAGLTGP